MSLEGSEQEGALRTVPASGTYLVVLVELDDICNEGAQLQLVSKWKATTI